MVAEQHVPDHRAVTRSSRAVLALFVALSAALSACGVPPEPARPSGPSSRAARPSASSSASGSAGAAQAAAPARSNRRPLGDPREEPLTVELLPMAGGSRVLAVAQVGEPTAW